MYYCTFQKSHESHKSQKSVITPLSLSLRNPKTVEELLKAGATINPNDYIFKSFRTTNKLPSADDINEIFCGLFRINPYSLIDAKFRFIEDIYTSGIIRSLKVTYF
jgi:hypothetical protein